MLDHAVELVSDAATLAAVVARLGAAAAFALDIETINWWDREAERVALVQLAFREGGRPWVAVVDALAGFDLAPLRGPLELSPATKAIHNASYDAVRLERHYRIRAAPIHDTMLAARRGGERRCSLQAQAEAHLGLRLDKAEQRGDWSRRPLGGEQLRYAALDAACTLLLYEGQVARGLRGEYALRAPQTSLPLEALPPPPPELAPELAPDPEPVAGDIGAAGLALLGVIAELPGRYGPEQLAASAGSERVGLAGWIIDQALGPAADLDEGSARQEIASLCERGLARLGATRRLEATPAGDALWRMREQNTDDTDRTD